MLSSPQQKNYEQVLKILESNTKEALVYDLTTNIKFNERLLKIVNSPLCGSTRKFNNLPEAFGSLGLTCLRKWAIIITFSSFDDLPATVFQSMLTRAKFCELLCQRQNVSSQEDGFLVGLFSGVDSILNIDKGKLIDKHELSSKIKNAILNNEGILGEILNCAIAFESNNHDFISEMDYKKKGV